MTQGHGHIDNGQARPERKAPKAEARRERPEVSDVPLEAAEKREQAVEADFLNRALENDSEGGRAVVEVFENASDLIDKIDSLLVRHALKSGFDRERAFESFGDRTFAEAIKEIRSTAEKLAETYFLNQSSTDDLKKYAAVVTTTFEFIDLLRQSQIEGSVPTDLSAKDAFKLIAQNITALALQDKGHDVTTIVELDATHLTEHDIRGCMQLADTLSDHGCALSALERLLLHQSMVYHCVGYMAPPILEAIADKGMNGKHLGVPMLAAHYVRNQYEDPASGWRSVFNEKAFELLHRAVLYQDNGAQGSADMALHVAEESTEETRAHNLEAIVRIAHHTPEDAPAKARPKSK